MKATLVVASGSVRRLVRDRTAMIFVFVLPVMVILIVGLTVRGTNAFRVALVVADDGPFATSLASELRENPDFRASDYASEATARTALRRSEVDTVVVVPSDFDDRIAAGSATDVTVIGEQSNSSQQAAMSAVRAVVADFGGRVQAAQFASAQAGGPVEANADRASRLAATEPAGTTPVDYVNSASSILPSGYDYSAPTMLVLFVFINALAAGAVMIQTRKQGIYDRVLAAPVSARSIVAGETLCYLGLALFQSVLIVVIGAVVFGVHWGAFLPAVALIVIWALVGTGAGMLSGTLFRTPEQASSIGPTIGIALGMLGGCMWPLEIVGPTMARVGHLAPQAWAVDAWTTLLSKGGGLTDIVRDLTVLTAFALGFFLLAVTRLRHTLAN